MGKRPQEKTSTPSRMQRTFQLPEALPPPTNPTVTHPEQVRGLSLPLNPGRPGPGRCLGSICLGNAPGPLTGPTVLRHSGYIPKASPLCPIAPPPGYLLSHVLQKSPLHWSLPGPLPKTSTPQFFISTSFIFPHYPFLHSLCNFISLVCDFHQ